MTLARSVRSAAVLCLSLALPAAAKDVYKAFLDPANPQHKATLDILSRLDQTPNDASLHNDLGCLIARDGFWRDALREFETAQKLDKKDGRAPYNAGLVQTTRGEWGSARAAFKTAVDRDPGNWPAWWMLGFAQEKLGYADAAAQAYARSLRVDTSLFDVKRNPYALQSRLKARVLLETFDARFARAALPSTEQLAQPDVLTSFQAGRVAVSAAPGPVVSEEGRGRTAAPAGPGGGPAAVAAPAAGGAVVTSVPPVSSSRPAAPAAPLVSAPAAPVRSGGLDEAPPWFPQTSPAGPAPAKTPRPATNPDPGGTTTPAPPPPPGPGVG
ncbi:MAG TPA: tetratricopeptide repeat protein [Thermoanaerobaculia bacterium]|jgi:hypothetical protein